MTDALEEAAVGRHSGRKAAARGLSDWLSLAATPTFATMALLTALPGPINEICGPARGAAFLSGMVPMYLLMSIFHAPPWLRLFSGRP